MDQTDQYEHVGSNVPRVDSPKKVTGAARYPADVEHGLHAKVKRSPYAHADVVDVDTSDAETIPGVKAILTPWDVPDTKYASGDFHGDWAVLNETVRFYGEPVAAVAAEDEETVEEAVAAIEVEYDRKPAVFDPFEAMADDAPQIQSHEDVEGNVAGTISLETGDPDAAFEKADHVVESNYSTSRQSHVTPETYGCIADYRGGNLELVTAIDKPYFFLDELAGILDLPPRKIRIRLPEASPGGFGKENYLIPHLEPLTALLSMETERPVSLSLDRGENFYGTITRHPVTFTLKTGVMDDGTIVARECHSVADTGPYLQMGNLVVRPAMRERFHDLYPVENMRYEGKIVHTNNPVAGSCRGIGMTQVHYAMESQMDEIAEVVDVDPVELHRKNQISDGDTRLQGDVIEGDPMGECVTRAAEAANWPEGTDTERADDPRYATGIGMAIVTHISAVEFDQGTVVNVKVNGNGTIDVVTSNPDSGHGSMAMVAQVAADAIGVDPENVYVSTPDTAVTPPDAFGSAASRSTYVAGTAAYEAGAKVREELLDRAAEHLEASPEDLTISEDVVHPQGAPDRNVEIREIARAGIEKSYTFDDPPTRPTFGAFFAEVAVDRLTGELEVERMTAAQDVGFAVNPAGCEAQIEGGIQFGLEFLVEEVNIDESTGQPTNNSMVDYNALVATQVPREVESILVESNEEQGVRGAKGLGTGVMGAIAPSIANAVYDAVGERVTDLPLRPEHLLDGRVAPTDT